MRFSVYSPLEKQHPLVVTAECMRPSLDCEHELGPLSFKGTLSMDEGLLPTIAESISHATAGYEFVVYGDAAARSLEVLMQGMEAP